MTSPRVSVIVPVYNGATFLRETVGSVLGQTYAASEVIVVDDGSSDASDQVVAEFPAVRYLRKANGGPASARNLGITASSFEFLAFIDQDDLWHPAKLERQIACFEAEPELDLCYALVDFFWDPALDAEARAYLDHPRTRKVPGYTNSHALGAPRRIRSCRATRRGSLVRRRDRLDDAGHGCRPSGQAAAGSASLSSHARRQPDAAARAQQARVRQDRAIPPRTPKQGRARGRPHMSRSASVSFVIPVHNGAAYLAESIDSVLKQTEPPSEVIVVDDGSTDRGAEIAEFIRAAGSKCTSRACRPGRGA